MVHLLPILSLPFKDYHNLDSRSRGWILQLAARASHYWGNTEDALRLQQEAFVHNDNLLKPQIQPPYVAITAPGSQALGIVAQMQDFQMRRGYLSEFEKIVSHLVPDVSSGQFEEALARLGGVLGFNVDRPDKKCGQGPDVLWLLTDRLGLIIEVKSKKQAGNALTKEEHGQLLNAGEWFKEKYPAHSGILVCVHPNTRATRNTPASDSKALTFDKLNELVSDTRHLLQELCSHALPHAQLEIRCEQSLQSSHLQPQKFIQHYLVPFQKIE
ncbi:MAG: hypothetical protein HC884_17155 [Chloroflexaceae bacterium]|nr:hypothetical protein [Chloroflexaceae bacterium]